MTTNTQDLIDRAAAHQKAGTALCARRDLIAEQLAAAVKAAAGVEKETKVVTQSRDIVNEVLLATQGQATTLIEDLVSLALSSVYGPEYGFELEYQVKRNQSEATPWITRGGQRFSPRDEVGCGVLDVCSLGLRLALWALTEPRPAPVFILDEPGRYLSRDKQLAFGRMLKEVSEMLNIQIVFISHSTAIIEQADKAYEVELIEGTSHVRRLEN